MIWMAPAGSSSSASILRELCDAFPHRGMGSANERAAADWIAAKLRQMGYVPDIEPFRTTVDNLYFVPTQVFACACAAAGIALFTGVALVGGAILAYGIALLVLELSGDPESLGVLPKKPSQNVVTRGENSARTLYISAHYDTQLGSYLFHPGFVDYLRPFLYACYTGLLLTCAGVLLRIARIHAAGPVLWIALAWCGCALAAFLAAEVTGRYTPGANDNGTGVALALWLACDYAGRRSEYPADCDLRFLFTGCEEAGERGMKAFLSHHGQELERRGTMFVNLDNLGTGEITYLSGEGMLFYRKAGRALLGIAREMSGGLVRERSNLLLPTDVLPALALGFEAISFLGMDEKGRLGNYHWHTDTFDNVDQQFLARQESFFRHYVKLAMRIGQ